MPVAEDYIFENYIKWKSKIHKLATRTSYLRVTTTRIR
jgi:hypothetical protein